MLELMPPFYFLTFAKVLVSVSKTFGLKKSLVIGLENILSRKKSQYQSRKNLVSKKSRYRSRKDLVSKKSLGISLENFGLKKSLGISLENFVSKKSLSNDLKNFVLVLVSKTLDLVMVS